MLEGRPWRRRRRVPFQRLDRRRLPRHRGRPGLRGLAPQRRLGHGGVGDVGRQRGGPGAGHPGAQPHRALLQAGRQRPRREPQPLSQGGNRRGAGGADGVVAAQRQRLFVGGRQVPRRRPAQRQRLPALRTARARLGRQRPQVGRRAGQGGILQQPHPQPRQPLIQCCLDLAERRPRVPPPPLLEPAQAGGRLLLPPLVEPLRPHAPPLPALLRQPVLPILPRHGHLPPTLAPSPCPARARAVLYLPGNRGQPSR
jgi:hypothetical protein